MRHDRVLLIVRQEQAFSRLSSLVSGSWSKIYGSWFWVGIFEVSSSQVSSVKRQLLISGVGCWMFDILFPNSSIMLQLILRSQERSEGVVGSQIINRQCSFQSSNLFHSFTFARSTLLFILLVVSRETFPWFRVLGSEVQRFALRSPELDEIPELSRRV